MLLIPIYCWFKTHWFLNFLKMIMKTIKFSSNKVLYNPIFQYPIHNPLILRKMFIPDLHIKDVPRFIFCHFQYIPNVLETINVDNISWKEYWLIATGGRSDFIQQMPLSWTLSVLFRQKNYFCSDNLSIGRNLFQLFHLKGTGRVIIFAEK